MTTKRVTAKEAASVIVKNQIKFQKRGYGNRVIIINDCPDCGGLGRGCATCGDEPNHPEKLVKLNGKWYEKVGGL